MEWTISCANWIFQGGPPSLGVPTQISGLSIEECINHIADLGFKAVELRVIENPPKEFPKKRVKVIRNILKSRGISVANVMSDTIFRWPKYAFTNPDKKIRKEVVNHFKGCAEFTTSINCDKIGIWAGAEKIPLLLPFKDAFEIFMNTLSQCVEIAQKYKLKIGLEYKPYEFIGTSDMVLRVLDKIKSPNLGTLLDAGHVLFSSEDLLHVVDKLAEYIIHIHLNDNHGSFDEDLAVGTVHNFEPFFKKLKSIRYQGYVSLDLQPGEDADQTVLSSKEYIETLWSSLSI